MSKVASEKDLFGSEANELGNSFQAPPDLGRTVGSRPGEKRRKWDVRNQCVTCAPGGLAVATHAHTDQPFLTRAKAPSR